MHRASREKDFGSRFGRQHWHPLVNPWATAGVSRIGLRGGCIPGIHRYDFAFSDYKIARGAEVRCDEKWQRMTKKVRY